MTRTRIAQVAHSAVPGGVEVGFVKATSFEVEDGVEVG